MIVVTVLFMTMDYSHVKVMYSSSLQIRFSLTDLKFNLRTCFLTDKKKPRGKINPEKLKGTLTVYNVTVECDVQKFRS